VIVGDQELADGTVTVRPLRAEFGEHQDAVPRAGLVAHLSSLLTEPKDPA
jgi:histidyl-tRNA synthetase